MHTALLVLGFVARLILTWLATELIRNFLSGSGFGLVEIGPLRRMAPAARAVFMATRRERSSEAHLRAARWSTPLCLLATVGTRLYFWDRGNFDLLSFGLPIVLGVAVGTPIGIWAFRRTLYAPSDSVSPAPMRPPADTQSARAMLKSGIAWTPRVVERARASEPLQDKIRKAVTIWDSLEQLAGDVPVRFEDLLNKEAIRRKQSDFSAIAKRAAARETVNAQFEAALADIATDVARQEGRPDLAQECLAALMLDFFDVAEQLRT